MGTGFYFCEFELFLHKATSFQTVGLFSLVPVGLVSYSGSSIYTQLNYSN